MAEAKDAGALPRAGWGGFRRQATVCRKRGGNTIAPSDDADAKRHFSTQTRGFPSAGIRAGRRRMPLTSAAGRFQLAEESANSVSVWMPSLGSGFLRLIETAGFRLPARMGPPERRAIPR